VSLFTDTDLALDLALPGKQKVLHITEFFKTKGEFSALRVKAPHYNLFKLIF
jgi:hypothetical protein